MVGRDSSAAEWELGESDFGRSDALDGVDSGDSLLGAERLALCEMGAVEIGLSCLGNVAAETRLSFLGMVAAEIGFSLLGMVAAEIGLSLLGMVEVL